MTAFLRQVTGADVKVAADCTNNNQLPNDTKFYVATNSINTTLYQSIISQTLSTPASPVVVTNSTVDTYSMASTASNSLIVHAYTGYAYYNLPTPSAGFTVIFQNQQSIPSTSTNIVVSASNQTLYWTSNSTNYSANIATGSTYTTATLATAITSAMNGAQSNSYTCTYSNTTQKFTIAEGGSYTFKFTFATNTTNSARQLIGFLAVDGTLATSQVGNPMFPSMRIAPASGHSIKCGDSLVINPGYLDISRKGASVTLIGLDSTTWGVFDTVSEQSHKNTTLGAKSSDVAIVGRDVWVTKATGGTARSDLAGFSLNGYGYICDGYTGSYSNEVNQYNDSANTWATKATGGTARDQLAGFSLNGYGYICDGYNAVTSNEVNQYNDAANTWATMATGGTARTDLAGFSLNGYGYICDGYSTTYSNEVNQYNDSANSWATKATGGTAREGSGGFTLNGYGYICNGTTGSYSNEVNQYNDSANTWTARAAGGTARVQPAGFSLNGYGYICNGQNPSSSNEVNQYNDSANAWITKATGGTARKGLGCFTLNGYGYICDGYIAGSYTNEVNQYN